MNTEQTGRKRADIVVAGYSDGVYNVEFYHPGSDEQEILEIEEEEARRLCGFFDVQFPDPDPVPPEQWG